MAAKRILPRGKWRLCISHDVDHLKHYFNFNLVKFWGVSFAELLYRQRGLNSFFDIIGNSFNEKNDSWNQTELLASINRKYKIPATFFFCVKKGRGVDYNLKEVKNAISKLKDFEIGIHGQEYQNIVGIEEERDLMSEILEKKPEGIRIHYLKWAPQTVDLIERAGYFYDSTEYSEELKQPYFMDNGLIEIPIHIMDTYLFSPFYKNFTLEQAKKHTTNLIAKAKRDGKILHVLFHLRHLAPEFQRQREFYLWLLELAKSDKKCEKISCGQIAKRLS
ncbi:TPA: hypothetical protein H1005_01650 [archaeon]|uniref:NodB homology domain-containing protein n=1 Tax=Candidatus Naiadarchaeum limnaeum TaxID=2756139 RepID=A0A832UNY7_9ARCH|nr:hypothetical protein [Candidatus Naiadarchaeales archaeon SRR2090153.bin1042]HIK00704.1 hypothetical protein [Candidatus Naiadarchaeum limnaeum]